MKNLILIVIVILTVSCTTREQKGITITSSDYHVEERGRVEMIVRDTIFNKYNVQIRIIELTYVGNIANVEVLNDTLIKCHNALV